MLDPRRVKTIFFDAGGTLFRPYPSVGAIYARTAEKHGLKVEPERLEDLFREAWHSRDGLASLAGATSDKIERDWWYGLVKDIFDPLALPQTLSQDGERVPDVKRPLDIRDPLPSRERVRVREWNFEAFFEELYDLFARAECWKLFDDSISTLETLKSKGYRLGMISNWDHRLFSIVEALGLKGYFEKVTASAVVGVAKPGAAIFHQALEALGALPAESLHIGDSLTDDYHGALSVGMQAVLLSRQGKAYNGVVRVESLLELPGLLS